MAHEYCKLHLYMVFYIIKLFVISVHFSSTQVNNNNERIDCFQTPNSVSIKCRTVNASNWTCVTNNEISVPQTPENKNCSINCTAPYPIDIDINGFQLHDNYTTYFVRNAENISDETTFEYSIEIPCGSLSAPRRVTIRKFNDSNVETSFYILRSGFTYFDKNITHSSEKPTKIKEIIIGAGVAIFLFIVPLVYVMWRLKIAKNALRNLTDAEVDEFLKGNPEILKTLHGKETPQMADFLPYNPDFEIPNEKLLIDTNNVLGCGAFGTVLKGKLEGIEEYVAVKTVNSKCDIDHFKGFLSELKIMMYIGSHPNIVTLFGAYTEKIRERKLFIVVELCTLGSVDGFLRDRRSHFWNQIINDEIVPNKEAPLVYQNVATIANGNYDNSLKTIDLVVWSYQIVNGMEYLASKKVVYADLAARNVLLYANGTAKITDFGLSSQLLDFRMYVKKEGELLPPWRWMAIESLQHFNFSTQSDVWAYGVFLWEIFSLGDVPYSGLSWTIRFVEELCNGLRLIKPTFATNSIYKIMFDCWKEDGKERPTFKFIKEYFRNMMITLELDVEKIDSVASKPYGVRLKSTKDSSEDGKYLK